MKKKRILMRALAVVCSASLLAGCGGSSAADNNAGKSDASGTASDHEALSICNPFRDVNAFIDVVHKYYPEINF